MTQNLATATLGGGCFWCLEAVFLRLQGVHKVVSGYTGGLTEYPDYKAICNGNTGHAEVVQISYDPQQLTFAELLEVFFTIHDPTTLNRQGNDVGTQYRSAIFCHDAEQQAVAQQVVQAFQPVYSQPIVTEVVALTRFWPAEDYHQRYFDNHPSQPYCAVVISPKLAKFRSKFAARMKG